MTTDTPPPPAPAVVSPYPRLHEHLTTAMHLLLDTLDQHPELAPLHVCTDSDGSIRVLVKAVGVPLDDRMHAVDVLAEAFHLPHAQASLSAYETHAGHSSVWTVTRTETPA